MSNTNVREVIAWKSENSSTWKPGMPSPYADLSLKILVGRGIVLETEVKIYRASQHGQEIQIAIKQ